jgi:outer membrane protein insertion porin family
MRRALHLLWILTFGLLVAAGNASAQLGGVGELRPPQFGSPGQAGDDEEGDQDQDEDEAGDEGEGDDDLDSSDLEGVTVLRVEVAGNRRVSAGDVRASIETRRGMPYAAARIARDIRKLYRQGFYSDVAVSAAREEGGLVLTFQVTEKAAVAEIRLEGNEEIKEEDIREVIDLKPNEPLDVPAIERNVQKIRDLYLGKGFFLAEVSYRLEETRGEDSYDVVFAIAEHAKVEVRHISFVGNRALTDAQINAYMATKTAGPLSVLTDSGKFKREMFDRDITVIQAIYWDHGYIDIKVGNPRVELSADRRYIFVSIPVEEGPRYRVGRIKVVERDRAGREVELLEGRRKVRSMVRTERGEWFSRTKVMEDVNRITRHYQDHGYANTNVDLKTDTSAGERIVDLTLEISRGPMVYFERIELRGNTKTRDRVIRRELRIREGEKYSQTGIEVSKALVTRLGFFERVDITTTPGSTPDKVIVNVEVVEKHTGQFQVGMGFSTVENFIAQAQVTEQNFLGQGQTVSLQAQISSMRQVFMINFWEPYFLDSDWTFAFRLYDQVMAMVDYNKESTGGEITLGHSLVLPDLKLYLSYNLEYNEIDTGQGRGGLLISGRRLDSGFRNLPLAYLFREGLSSSVKSTLAYDKRNNRLFPTEGSYNSASVEWASEWLGSDFEFTRYAANSRWYFPLFWKLVLRLQGRFGLIHSNTSEGLPIAQRYRSGGIMDVRGFYPWSLGPRISIPSQFDPNQAPLSQGINIGGNMQLTFNTEIEFPIIEIVGIKGVVFFDAGNSFNLEESWCQAGGGRGINEFTDPCNKNPFLLRTSTGFGFRWFSPMGPLRFEWGFPTTTYPGEEDHMFEFTFGNFF